jgi:ABC-type phosphate transport system permease subunit
MSIDSDLRKLKTGTRDLRKFGLTVGSGFVLLGVLLFLRHRSSYPYFVDAGVGLITFGVIWPRALKYIYIAWMASAFTLGFVMSNVILALFFFLFVTPIGLLARLFQKDFLARRWDKKAVSYWIDRAREMKTAEGYERQF